MRELLRRIASVVRHRTLDADLVEEIEFHRAMKERELEANGLDSNSARISATRALGNDLLARERSRDVWLAPWLHDAAMDVRFAWRVAAKDPWFTFAVVAILAVGIGANTAVFTLFNAVFLRGLPVDSPDRVVAMSSGSSGSGPRRVSFRDYEDWRTASRAFTALKAFQETSVSVSDDRRAPERLIAGYVSAGTFAMLGERPEAGRDFTDADDRLGAPAVAILASDVWTNRFAADPAVIGRTIRVDGTPTVVVGIMRNGFQYPTSAEIWLPLASLPGIHDQPRNARPLSVVGRLADGVSLEQAQADMGVIAARLARDYPESNAGIDARVMPFTDAFVGGPLRLMFLALLALVAFVLLIACANVANLLLGRSMTRAREMALRASLGASRARIVRQLIVESLMLAVIGGAAGMWIARAGVQRFADFVGQFEGKPYWIQFTMDGGVFAFVAAVCLGTGIAFGLVPALHLSRTNLTDLLSDGGRGGTTGLGMRRVVGGLVTLELALTIVLLAGAGLLFRSAFAHSRMDAAVNSTDVLTMRITLPSPTYLAPSSLLAFHDALHDRMKALPGVESATIASALPLAGARERELLLEGQAQSTGARLPNVDMIVIGTDYFRTLRVPLLHGREFARDDGVPGREHVIVSERFAAAHFGSAEAIGGRIRLVNSNARDAVTPWLTIVGIAPTIRQRTLGEPQPLVYLPFPLEPMPSMALVLASNADASSLASEVREEIRALDADLPVFAVMTLDRAMESSQWPGRFFRVMLTMFAAVGLVLSATGVYAVTAQAVGRRTREIGVRIALGARRSQVYRLVLSQVVVQVAVGLILGLAGAAGVGVLLRTFLFQTSALDPTTLAGISVLLALIVVAACLAPARRAATLDPVAALRSE